MCEIILIILLAKKIASIASEKGRSGVGYGFMFAGLWIGGEILGLIVGTVLFGAAGGGRDSVFLVYGCALAGAAAGAVLSFIIVSSLSPVDLRRDDLYYRNDNYDDADFNVHPDRRRRRRRRRSHDDNWSEKEDDYDRPKRDKDEPPEERIRR
jgi:hypothetical protein